MLEYIYCQDGPQIVSFISESRTVNENIKTTSIKNIKNVAYEDIFAQCKYSSFGNDYFFAYYLFYKCMRRFTLVLLHYPSSYS